MHAPHSASPLFIPLFIPLCNSRTHSRPSPVPRIILYVSDSRPSGMASGSPGGPSTPFTFTFPAPYASKGVAVRQKHAPLGRSLNSLQPPHTYRADLFSTQAAYPSPSYTRRSESLTNQISRLLTDKPPRPTPASPALDSTLAIDHLL